MSDTLVVVQSSPLQGSTNSPESSNSTDASSTVIQNDTSDVKANLASNKARPASESKSDSTQGNHNHPPPKTDKPRPHICGTCQRSFARLEHLKRHERSHTKEKPFECPDCTRCFARRDLLLRHQQKLHSTTTPASRPRGGRRESINNLAAHPSGKIRKNSATGNGSGIAGAGHASSRPRANTISHIDGATLGVLNRPMAPAHGYGSMPSVGMHGYHASNMSVAAHNHGHHPTLPRLATQNINTTDVGDSLKTAPPGQGMGGFGFDRSSFGSTVNPAQLHMGDQMGAPSPAFGGPISPFTPQPAIMEDDTDGSWMHDFDQMNFNGPQSPHYPNPSSNMMGSGPLDPTHLPFNPSVNPFQDAGSMVPPQVPGTASMPMESVTGPLMQRYGSMSETISPTSLHAQAPPPDMAYSTPSPLNTVSPGCVFPGTIGPLPPHSAAFSPDGTSVSSASIRSSARQSSVTSVSTDSITEVTRHALLMSLSQPPGFGPGHRKYSQPSISSPLSARDPSRSSMPGVSLPNTPDLQRFVGAYIQYFHPHFPFLHIPTLSFDSPAYTSDMRASNCPSTMPHGGVAGGGGCLILAMAAIGALYEFDKAASSELFEASKRMIQLYLEERRNMYSTPATSARPTHDAEEQNTPLWFVQAMLLNVVYGHNCGDKVAGDIASTHSATLLRLAVSARLNDPLSYNVNENAHFDGIQPATLDYDVTMEGNFQNHEPSGPPLQTQEEYVQWRRWIAAEERKRTLFAIFHMSSLLVSAYNHAPALSNSEIQIDLPCDEELWAAEDARTWAVKRNQSPVETDGIPFASALSTLLSASQNQDDQFRTMPYSQPFGSGMPRHEVPQSDLRPSTFGCLILIDALHNYIWETRQRRSGYKWTTHDTESWHAFVEPALRAWQAAWASNHTHSLERPNPYGLGPLSADSIPLLDLAYVRLFVSLGASKEAFWRRDFEAMAEELARGSEIIQHADHSDIPTDAQNTATNSPMHNSTLMDISSPQGPTGEALGSQPQRESSKRERHLRKAAFYAADSLAMSDKLGVTFADFTSRELPIQSALCAFDCAQVLAEWVATVQERVGRYLGILGRDDFNPAEVPAIMILEDEDLKLLQRISEILQNAEAKMTFEVNRSGIDSAAAAHLLSHLPSRNQSGFGTKILNVTACMMQKSAVWPVTETMTEGLFVQANHMMRRAENSLIAQ